MNTSRFQLGLIATLAVGLGFSLSSSEAIGYPAGAAVSMGTNPVWSVAGTETGGGTDLFAAPSDRVTVITDILFDTSGSYSSCPDFTFKACATDIFTPDGDNAHRFESGLIVPAGEPLRIKGPTTSTCKVNYTLSGYYAQP